MTIPLISLGGTHIATPILRTEDPNPKLLFQRGKNESIPWIDWIWAPSPHWIPGLRASGDDHLWCAGIGDAGSSERVVVDLRFRPARSSDQLQLRRRHRHGRWRGGHRLRLRALRGARGRF